MQTQNNKINIYQIFYDKNSERKILDGFIPLDNSNSPHPEWREYYPIHKKLSDLLPTLNEDAYTGFISPNFYEKTHITHKNLISFLKIQAKKKYDFIGFSGFFDQGAFFMNVFYQGENHHKGLIEATNNYLSNKKILVDVRKLIDTTENISFSNFFVAKKVFWEKWLEINYDLFYADKINATNEVVNYKGKTIPLKVFIMERTATLILNIDQNITRTFANPFLLPPSRSKLANFKDDLIILDALKISLKKTGNVQFLEKYNALKIDLIEKIKNQQPS